MQTIKLQYKQLSNEDAALVKEYQRQYSHCLRVAYNRALEGWNENNIKHWFKNNMNNVPLMECWFFACAANEGKFLTTQNHQKHLIFGGKNNFIKRCQNKITKEEFNKNRLSPLCSIGEANQKGNRKFSLNSDLSVTFKPSKNTHIKLEFKGISKNYYNILSKLYTLKEAKDISITFRLDSEYVYISFDEAKTSPFKCKTLKNRIMAIDLNPNYVGWSVVDWKSSESYKVIASGVYSIKPLNDKECNSNKRLTNKRKHEVFEISKSLVNTAMHYQCEIFSCEELSIGSSDKGKGRKFNRLCNNLWNRNKFQQNISKRCNLFGLKYVEVKANYSSFIGNVLYRKLGECDMVLSSIEIGRRGYEYYNQYIRKENDVRKNIVQPLMTQGVRTSIVESLEEFGYVGEWKDCIDLYYRIKESKPKYRFYPTDFDSRFLSCFSRKSLILRYCNIF